MDEMRDEMTIETAVKILNFDGYQGRDQWRLSRNLTHVVSGGVDDDARPLWMIEVKEAVAIAKHIYARHARFVAEFGEAAAHNSPMDAAHYEGTPAAEPRRRGPSREWLERAGDVEDATRGVSVGGLAVDTGMYGVAASLAQEARDRAAAARRPQVPSKAWALGFAFGLRDGCPGPERFWEHAPDFQRGFDAARSIKGEMPAEARSQVGEATRKVLECIADHLEGRDDDDPEASFAVWHRIDDARAALRECGMEDAQATPSESVPCSTPSPSTVIPPDQATWDILCAYLAGEEHHGSEISEGRLTEILRHRIGWGRIEVRTAWFDAVARGNALIEADHERIRPIREAEAARLMAEAERRRGGSAPTESDSSSESS